MILEIACFTSQDAFIAIEGGADRIELCKSINSGGLTPSVASARELCAESPVPVFVMIRPSGKNFVYDEKNFERMKKQIKFFKSLNCAGFVFGCLQKDGQVHKKQCKELVKLAAPLSCTFHRAFDRTPDLSKALEDVIACGFDRLLTSGGEGKAIDNMGVLKKLFRQAGKRITIIPGGGVRAQNMAAIMEATKCREIHSAARHPTRRRISLDEVKAMKEVLA